MWNTASVCRCRLEHSDQRKTATPGHMPTVSAAGDPGSYRPHLAKDEIGMTSVPDATDVPPPSPRPSICPACGLTADNGITVHSELTSTATFVDTAGHLWAVTWLAVA